MKRRRFLQHGAAGALLAGCDNTPFAFIPPWLPISVLKPGMTEGHRLRELKQLPVSSGERRSDTLISGSGGGMKAKGVLSPPASSAQAVPYCKKRRSFIG